MVCSNCGTENEPGRKFCGECGTRLAALCPACGAANSATSKFCGECATPLATAPLLAGATPTASSVATGGRGLGLTNGGPAATAPVAERRLVSILFADLVGFTTIAEGRDAEDTRELLTRYFDLSREVIERYGGTVEKFIGDAVMAVWGAPVAREDDAERSVRAALDLVDAVRALGPGIEARAGVLTGEAAVTIGATNQGMVAGDIVNTASRLQSAAAPGTVLVGEATQRAASAAIAFEEVGEQVLKGKATPVPAWKAMRVVAQVGGRNRSDTLEAPFVGRDDDLRLLKDLFHATGRERKARLVSIIGPAGIGKSRLAWEFHKYIDGIVEAVWYHEGRSPAYGDGITFWALGEMVRRRAGLVETDDEATTRTKIAASVAEHVPDPDERAWIEPALLALLGIEANVGADQLFGAWRTFFERLSATGPVLMVFEDFHFADSGLIDFVDHLMEWSRGYPISVVTLARPELLERRPDWGAGKRSFTSLFLEPLSEEAMRELLAGLVPGLPAAAERAIVARADGIPLYAIETIRMLVADGQLVLEGNAYRPVGDLSTLAVPETLTALIASRLDGLPPADRALISDAAVLGQSFTLDGLAALSGLPETELIERLHALVRREFLTLVSDPRSPERGQYIFVQALIREVAYNGLARRDRKDRHLAAARFFERLETDEIAGALAGHYFAAYRNSPEGAEAEAVGAQARIALSAAAERAIALGSYEQGLGFLEQAIEVTTDPAESADLLERAGSAASAFARHEVAEELLRSAVAARRALGDRARVAGAIAALGQMLLTAQRTPEAIGLLEPASEEFEDLTSQAEGIFILSQLARAYFLVDDNRRAIEIADRVLEAAEHSNAVEIVADTLVTKGTALGILGRPIEGRGALTAARDLAESHGLGLTVLRAVNNRSFLENASDPRAGLVAARAGLDLARRLGARSWVPIFVVNYAELAMRTGDWQMGAAEIRETLAESYEPIDQATLLLVSVPILALRGDPVDELLAEAIRLLADSEDPQLQIAVPVAQAFAALGAGDLGSARRLWRGPVAAWTVEAPTSLPRAARAALWAGDPAGARDDLAALAATHYHSELLRAERVTITAGIAALEGRPAESMTLYREALRVWRDLGLAWDEALCGLDMAILLDANDPEVRAAGANSREILVRLEAKPFIDRLDAALARVPDTERAKATAQAAGSGA